MYAWPKFHGSSPYSFWENDLNAKTQQKFTLPPTTQEKQYICLASALQVRQKLIEYMPLCWSWHFSNFWSRTLIFYTLSVFHVLTSLKMVVLWCIYFWQSYAPFLFCIKHTMGVYFSITITTGALILNWWIDHKVSKTTFFSCPSALYLQSYALFQNMKWKFVLKNLEILFVLGCSYLAYCLGLRSRSPD